MQADPVASKASELLRLGKMPSASEVKGGVVRTQASEPLESLMPILPTGPAHCGYLFSWNWDPALKQTKQTIIICISKETFYQLYCISNQQIVVHCDVVTSCDQQDFHFCFCILRFRPKKISAPSTSTSSMSKHIETTPASLAPTSSD